MAESLPKEFTRALTAAGMGDCETAIQELHSLSLKLEGESLRRLSELMDDLPPNPGFEELWPRLTQLRAVLNTPSGAWVQPHLEPQPAAAAPAPAPAPAVAGQPPRTAAPVFAPTPTTTPTTPPTAPAPAPATVPPAPAAPEALEPHSVFYWKTPELGDETLRSYFSEATECLDLVAQLVANMQTGSQDEMAEVYRKLHTVKGSSGMFGLRPVESLVHTMEDLVRAVKGNEIPFTDDARLLIARGVVTAREAVTQAQKSQQVSVDIRPMAAEVRTYLERAKAGLDPVQSAPAPAPQTTIAAPQHHSAPTPPTHAPSTAAAPAAPQPLPSATRTAPVPSTAAKVDSHRSLESMQLRVEFSKVDHLASMVGEQTMQQEEVGRHLGRMQEAIEEIYRNLLNDPSGGSDSALQYLRSATRNLNVLASSLESKAQQLDLTSNKIQGMVLDLRMTRVGDLFQKHTLTVMTAAAAQGKKARLHIEGGDTRLDKSIVEKLDEPLLHLIRNAVSHGIGNPADRQAQGKSPEGRVTVRAFHRGNHVVVQVEDDGNGIDPIIIRRKAVEKGFLTPEEASLMDDARVIDLIFAPGFSTTNVVNDISGRGVGLDSVRSEINRINGAVQLHSKPGEGTVFELVLPLTLALSRMLLVEIAGETVALPSDNVGRVASLAAADVVRLEGRYLARLGEESLPLVYLDRTLRLSTIPVVRKEYTICIVSHGSQQAALVVDKTVDYMQAVIRDVGPLLPRVRHCMGVTFFEGSCVLILDPGALIRGWHEGSLSTGGDAASPRAAILTDAPERFASLHFASRRMPLRVALVDPAAFKPAAFSKVHQVWVDGHMEDVVERLSGLNLDTQQLDLVLWASADCINSLDKVALYKAGIHDVLVGGVPELLDRLRAKERKEGLS